MGKGEVGGCQVHGVCWAGQVQVQGGILTVRSRCGAGSLGPHLPLAPRERIWPHPCPSLSGQGLSPELQEAVTAWTELSGRVGREEICRLHLLAPCRCMVCLSGEGFRGSPWGPTPCLVPSVGEGCLARLLGQPVAVGGGSAGTAAVGWGCVPGGGSAGAQR